MASPIKLRVVIGLLAGLLNFVCQPLVADAEVSGGEGSYIVGFEENWAEKLREAVPGLEQYSDEELKKAVVLGLGAQTSLSDNLKLVDAQAARVPPGHAIDTDYAETLIDRGIVSYIEPDYVVHTNEVVPNDPMFNQLYAMKNASNGNYDIDATDAWTKTTGSSDVVVGIVDTGIDWTHPDLSPNIWRNTGEIAGNNIDDDHNGYVDDVYGWNGITNSGNALDDNGHGTHCAGTIGASGNNSIGVAGVNWDVRLMPLKFLSAGGSGATSDAVKVIDYAVTMKNRGVNIRVLSNSWGGGGYSQALYDAIERAKTANILFVAAAGNSASNNDVVANYPSNYTNSNIVAVAAVDSAGALASFSSYGLTTVDLGAPGVGIVSTYPGNQYRSLSGTSMATPHVAGVAALILASRPTFTVADVKAQLLSNTRPLASLSGKTVTGGLLNANLAVPPLNGNLAPRITPVSDMSISSSTDFVNVTISATDPEGSPVTLGAAITPAIQGSPNVQLTLTGTNLKINPDTGYNGTFTVEISASDGQLTSRRTFQVEVKNFGPSLAAISDKTMSYQNASLQVALSASDPDNDPITFTASLQSIAGYAYELDQQYDFYQYGNTYFDNYSGLNEKWILANKPNYNWFYILPDGKFYIYEDSGPVYIATFPSTYWTDPSKFFNVASPAAFGGSATISGQTLTITRPTGFVGTFFVKVYATATGGQAFRRFAVTVANSTPTLSTFTNRTMYRSSTLNIPYAASDVDGDTVTVTASMDTTGTGISTSVVGSNIRLITNSSYLGTASVRVRASDGVSYIEKVFQVTVQNQRPTLNAIADQLLTPGQQVTLTLVGSDPEGASLLYGASVKSVRRTAYELDQRFNLYKYQRSYFEGNAGTGQAERWIRATNEGAPFLIIMQDGTVRRWAGTIASSPIVAVLTPDYYANPTLLFDVPVPPAAGVSTRTIGNQLTLQAAAGFAGAVDVMAIVSDGIETVSRVFRVTVRDTSRTQPTVGNGFDSDGDGISDEQEIADGTDPFDSGSLKQDLEGSIYTMWNGFLNMTNILELVNGSEETLTIKLVMYDINGNLGENRTIQIAARGQFDVIVNELFGFHRDSYGLIKLVADGKLEGRMFFYRPDNQGGYEFAYGVPLGKGTQGKSSVAFNTFQPSLDSSERGYLVANWLSVVNLAEGDRCFTVTTHGLNGELLKTRQLNVPAFGRVDVDGGHGLAGPSVVGQHVITPCNDTSPYLAQIVRYGTRGVSGASDNGFTFAFPLIARAGTNKTIYAPISRQFGEQTWLEVANGSAATAQARVQFYGADGSLRAEGLVNLPPNGQVHLDTSTVLTAGEVGSAVVIPQGSSSVLAQSMFYFRAESRGGIQAMYGIQAEESLGSSKTGSYNLFLGMSNWLILKNPAGQAKTVTLRVNSPNAVADEVVNIPAQGSVVLPIHTVERFHAPADTYGTVAIDGDPVIAQLIRMRRRNGIIDFAAPTTVR